MTDALEMNYSKSKINLEAVKQKLLHRPIKDSTLYPLPSFALEDALVVIQDGDLKTIRNLYLLDSHRQSFQVFDLGPEFGGGSVRDASLRRPPRIKKQVK